MGSAESGLRSVHVAPVAQAQDEHDQFVVFNVVHHSVVADSDPQLPVSALQGDATWWARIVRELLDRLENAPGGLLIELAERLSRRGDVGDPVRHGSEAELGGEVLV